MYSYRLLSSYAARSALKQARTDDEILPITQDDLETAIEETEPSLDAWE
jgi:SpoVK/Ycf46/Vps4 family AAA+-type ATPase